jgi:hypothetical protein
MEDSLGLAERLKARMGAANGGALLDLAGQTVPPVKKTRKQTKLRKAGKSEGRSAQESMQPANVGDLEISLKKSKQMHREHIQYVEEIEEHIVLEKYGDVARIHASTMIFGQKEGGSAVVISANGDILTCAHCLGSDPTVGSQCCLLSADGKVCLANVCNVDERADLALLKCVRIYDQENKSWMEPAVPFVFTELCTEESEEAAVLVNANPTGGSGPKRSKKGRRARQDLPVMCIGQSILARHLNLCISTGQYLGVYDHEADICDNWELGQLMHSAWTYYGTSGGPLFYRGKLIGLHSSYDSATTTRHGVHYEAIGYFLAYARAQAVKTKGRKRGPATKRNAPKDAAGKGKEKRQK